jgi:prepilin-type N-terminal cleavage/methylation domain-containing protein
MPTAPGWNGERPATGRRRDGFTLIELLTVVAIIILLATMTVFGTRLIRLRIQDLRTGDRMRDLASAFTQLGQGEGSAALVIQREAGIDGPLQWRVSKDRSEMVKRTKRIYTDNYSHGTASFADWVPQNLPDLDYWKRLGHSDPFPERNIGWVADGAYADAVTGGKDDGSQPFLRFPWGQQPPEELRRSDNTRGNDPQCFLLRHSSPHRTRQLLALTGLVPTDGHGATARHTAYLSDRDARRPWNDAWGRPLVVSFAMYLPPRNNPRHNLNNSTSDADGFGEDIVLNAAKDSYRTVRILYLTMVAAGPQMPELDEERLTSGKDADWDGPQGIPALIWKRVVVGDPRQDEPPVCQQGRFNATRQRWEGEWDQHAFDQPPFKGVRIADWRNPQGVVYHCFLNTPLVLD